MEQGIECGDTEGGRNIWGGGQKHYVVYFTIQNDDCRDTKKETVGGRRLGSFGNCRKYAL